LGAFLDINIDALGLLIAPLLAVWYGQLPYAYLSVGAAYYLLVFGIWLRKKYSKPVFEIKPRRSARIIAGYQMGFVGIALLPVISSAITKGAAYIFMIPLLAGFAKDWLVASGYRNLN
jgi:CDP-diacylglycerol--glycerol-3-phosphate 3-phosphatidyltransferase